MQSAREHALQAAEATQRANAELESANRDLQEVKTYLEETNIDLKVAKEHALHAEKIANAQRQRAEAEANATKSVLDFMQNDLLAQADPYIESDRNVKLRTVLDCAADRIETRFTKQPLVEALIRAVIGRTYYNLGQYSQARLHLERARELRVEHLGKTDPDTLESMGILGTLYRDMGDYARAEPLLQQSLQISKEVLGDEDPAYATSLNNLAQLYQAMGDDARAEPLYNKSVELYRTVLGEEQRSDYVTSLSNLGNLCLGMGDYVCAERFEAKPRNHEKLSGRGAPCLCDKPQQPGPAVPGHGRLRTGRAALPTKSRSLKEALGRGAPCLCDDPQQPGFALSCNG